jgi:hypothetical protein
MKGSVMSAVVAFLAARTYSIRSARYAAQQSVTSRAWRVAVAFAISLSAPGCRAYRPIQPPSTSVEPVRVRFASARDVVLRRDSPDSLLRAVTRLEGTLLWFDRDTLRLDVTRAETSGRWTDVAAPSTAVVAVAPGTVVEHRRLSRSRTL